MWRRTRSLAVLNVHPIERKPRIASLMNALWMEPGLSGHTGDIATGLVELEPDQERANVIHLCLNLEGVLASVNRKRQKVVKSRYV